MPSLTPMLMTMTDTNSRQTLQHTCLYNLVISPIAPCHSNEFFDYKLQLNKINAACECMMQHWPMDWPTAPTPLLNPSQHQNPTTDFKPSHSTIPPNAAIESFDYKMCLQELEDDCKQMEQCWQKEWPMALAPLLTPPCPQNSNTHSTLLTDTHHHAAVEESFDYKAHLLEIDNSCTAWMEEWWIKE